MKYKYFDSVGTLMFESDTPIHFGEEKFPAWNNLKPVIEKVKKKKSYYEDKENTKEEE